MQNATGKYAENIKYRAFGQIKQMDYNLLNDTPQIKLNYDNRLRVNHFEATSQIATSGFMMKSDFTYLADNSLQAKDDLLNDAWDRIVKYDHAGRMTFNQFNREYGTTGKRIYEQTIQYDAFSQMTSRQTTHWDNDGGGFTASYLNGRKQDATLTFDAAGNIVAQNNAVNEFQNTTFDAAGRRSAFLERWHTTNGPQSTFIVWENKIEQAFDGLGRPVIEKVGQRQMNQPVVPPLVTAPRMYQVWSSVLGGSLTEITPDGNKFSTKVFAGGAVIAKQMRSVENNQNYDSIEWTTADPVTGSIAKFSATTSGSGATTEEYEPLGQRIHPHDPAGDAEVTYNTNVLGSAGEAEWQCLAPKEFYGGFSGMPEHCQRNALYTAGIDLPWADEVSVRQIPIGGVDSPIPSIDVPSSASSAALAYALSATTKKDKKKKQKSHDTPDIDIGEFNVDVPISFLDATLIPGADASQSGINEDDKLFVPLPEEFRDKIKERLGQGDCNAFIAKLIAKAGEYTVFVKNGIGEIVKRSSLKSLNGQPEQKIYSNDGFEALEKVKGFKLVDKLKTSDNTVIDGTVVGFVEQNNVNILLNVRKVYIYHHYKGGFAKNYRLQQSTYIDKAIHEMIHRAG